MAQLFIIEQDIGYGGKSTFDPPSLYIHGWIRTFIEAEQEIDQQLKIDRTPHCCRHTCISMLAEAGVVQTIIKKIVGHSGAMTLTEKVYTHFDVKELVNAINKI